jgi:hypothetical protein
MIRKKHKSQKVGSHRDNPVKPVGVNATELFPGKSMPGLDPHNRMLNCTRDHNPASQ